MLLKYVLPEGCAEDDDWKKVTDLEKKINKGVNILQEDIQRIQQDEARKGWKHSKKNINIFG